MDKISNGSPSAGEVHGQEILQDSVYSDGGYIPQSDLNNHFEEDTGLDLEGYQPTYAEAFPPLPSAHLQNSTPTDTGSKWRTATGPIRSTTVTQVFRVPLEERRYKQPNENAFGDDRQREICRDIMAKTGAAIEISSGKDQGLTIMVTGKPELLAKARRMVLTQLQTQANVEINIPREHHKFILGKGGKTLQQLELQTATKITMPRDGSDLIRIVGTKEGVDSARHEIQIISDEQAKLAFERLNIEHVYHPFIAGTNAAKIMEQTGARINIPPPSAQKDEITIAGEKEGVAKAKETILAIYDEKKRKSTTVSIEVKKSQHKYVIGPRGGTLQEILNLTGVSVEMPPLDSDLETITLRGEPDKLGRALTQVYEKASSVVSAEVDAPRWLHRFIIGRKGQNIRKITQDLPKVHVEFSDEKDSVSLEGPPQEVEKAQESLETFIRELKASMDFAEITVDHKYHPHIIGKNGANVNRIKTETGTSILIPSNNEHSNVLRIEGSPKGVALAKEEILQMVKKLENEKTKDVIIEQRFHRTIIGAKGEKIREIRDKYPEVQISFPDAGKKSDIVNLRGPREGVDSVYTFLKKMNSELIAANFRVEVPIFKQFHKNVIGRGGTTIKKIREETDTKIELPSEGSDSDVIVITGHKGQVEAARDRIIAIQNELANVAQLEVNIPNKHHNDVIGAKGRLIRSIMDECGGVSIKFPPEGSNSDKVLIRGPKDDVEKAKKQLLDLLNEKETNSFTAEIRAKPQHHRFLIGRGGANIRKVRENTGARIVFPTPSDEDKELITIIGKKEGVDAAKQELLKAIKDLEVEELTELDKLYLAMAEVGTEQRFNTLCYSLGITSLRALKNYTAKPNKTIMASSEMDLIKKKIENKHFNFHQLVQKHKRSNVVETCTVKGIPVIHKQAVSVTKSLGWGPYMGCVCEALWTKTDGMKEKVCLRYGANEDQLFLHEAEMANVLRHKNILALYGVIIASSYSPSVALVVEFAEYGNLHESEEFHTVEGLCRFTIQTATALEHLETKKVIHHSVQSSNLLVVSKNQIKLAGLGSCRYEIDLKMNPVAHNYNQKDVVYRFGKLFSTYFSRYQHMATGYEIANVKPYSDRGYICPSHFCKVFDRCLQVSPEARPFFSEIRQSLVAQKYPSKVKVTNDFIAESPDFISCKTGDLILLISKGQHRKDNTAWFGETQDKKIGFFKSEYVEELLGYDIMDDSTVPPEIRARGPEAEFAFQKAMQNGRVKVFRGRIMLLGQDRAGKTSLKKSLLGMPFNPQEESTVGVEVDPSKCEVEVDQVKNWEPTKGKKLEVSEFVEDIARLIARDLSKTEAEQKDVPRIDSLSDQKNSDDVDGNSQKNAEASSTTANSTPDINQERNSEIDIPKDNIPDSDSSSADQVIQLNIEATAVLPKDVTELVIRYLQNLKLEDDIKAREAILTLWDFAGQHLYYASHTVFLSARAIYVLVYNLSKSLSAEAEPCVRQGIHEILLDNPNNETNLDNLLSWLVSIHSIRPTEEEEEAAGNDFNNQGAKLPYLRPPVFIVGTNADQPSEDAKKMEKCIQKSISGKSYEKHVIRSFFAVDNTKSQSDDGVQKLQKKIMEVLKQEPYMGEEVPLRWFNFEKVVEALVAKNTYHMALDQLLTVTRNVCHIDDEEELTAMLNFYHDLGVIVKHGQTVVLQAQWLIDLFKQLITVRPWDEVNPLYSECWNELEESGILRITLVDHVFTDFIQKGLNKQDILDMMELYGLIAKFPCLASEGELEQKYFVPAQLRSSPSGLCKIQPSESDPCPLYLHFLDGFVPHGLFSQLVSRCIRFCSEHGLKRTPQLYNNGARLFVGSQTTFDLFLICRKRFIKVILKKINPSSARSATTPATAKMAGEVRAFLEVTLQSFSRDLSWLHNLRYEVCVACTYCLQSDDQCTKHKSVCCSSDDCLHLLEVLSGEDLICPKSFCGEAIKVDGVEKWFEVQKVKTDEQKVDDLAQEESASLDQPQPLKSGSPSSDDLLLVAFELGTSWKMLGRALRLPEPVLEQIEEDERNLFDKCYNVLKRWTEAFGSDATYQCLARGLQHPIVGRPRLADKYCDAYRETFIDAVDQPFPTQTSDASSSCCPVFLSYQWDLQKTVKILKNKIEDRGSQCWMDIGEMGGGDALFAKIDAGIRACKVFVCCVTKKYVQSDTCQREATLADCLKKPIIPLLFEDIPWPPKGQLSLIFARLLYIRVAEEGGKIHDSAFDQLMKKLQQYVETCESV